MFHVKQHTKQKEFKMGKIISIVNQKGGVGKTTTSVNLSAAIGIAGKKVLLVDADPQGNTTSGYGINKKEVRVSSYELLVGKGKTEEAIKKTEFKNVDICKYDVAVVVSEVTVQHRGTHEDYTFTFFTKISD